MAHHVTQICNLPSALGDNRPSLHTNSSEHWTNAEQFDACFRTASVTNAIQCRCGRLFVIASSEKSSQLF